MEKIERGEKAGPFWGKRRPLAPCQARGSGEGEDKKGQLKAVKSREVGGAEGLCTLKRGTRPPTLSPMAAAPKFPVLFCQAEAAAQPWAGWKRSLGGDMLLLLFAFSGFGPFGEHTVNASWIAVQVTQMWRVGIRLRAGLPLEIDGTKERKESTKRTAPLKLPAKHLSLIPPSFQTVTGATYTRWLALHQALRISLTTFAWLDIFILVPMLLTRQLRPRESYLRSYSQETGVAVTQKCPVPPPGLGGPGRDVGGCINL